ncbi:hypothetical protein N7495_002013 [Penicillium taxi]|uniref:uncharacterized protein n=1 Tax=Penicillium taxi TaxID=168475 RepID=UPI0025453486|nr:uncharacterized protein N7495_002013 [Penicillium taxi]KAJ5901485.1 hypothetical protein N7495_002013 [Penicillium taxi]
MVTTSSIRRSLGEVGLSASLLAGPESDRKYEGDPDQGFYVFLLIQWAQKKKILQAILATQV